MKIRFIFQELNKYSYCKLLSPKSSTVGQMRSQHLTLIYQLSSADQNMSSADHKADINLS